VIRVNKDTILHFTTYNSGYYYYRKYIMYITLTFTYLFISECGRAASICAH